MNSETKTCTRPCSIERGMRLLGGKWAGTILWHLKDEPLRFNQLSRQVPGASKKMIVDRLRQLEDARLVHREVVEIRPVHVEYSLTELGKSTLDLLQRLENWIEDYETAIEEKS